MDQILLYIHIIAGSMSLISGSIILSLKKGDQFHKLLGRLFFYSLAISMIFSVPISIQKSNVFLFIIAVWTLYMLITGLRSLKKINIKNVNAVDWLITLVMLFFGIILSGYGVFALIKGSLMGLVAIVFGAISLLLVLSDIRFYRAEGKYKNQFLIIHIQRMVGAYIASITAFVVVNNTVLPNVVAWLLPTIILVPLIIYWTKSWGVVKYIS
ncbi:MAG TPA: hypothetical protein PKD85_18785 [Saprospiraceae bacterium]|nr:hypothetical protein [Saprospiraceae bacterium]